MRRSGHSLGSPCLIELPIRQWGTIALARIVDFSHLLDIRLSEPLPDEIDRQNQFMDARWLTQHARNTLCGCAHDADSSVNWDPEIREALRDTFPFAGKDCDAMTERVLVKTSVLRFMTWKAWLGGRTWPTDG